MKYASTVCSAPRATSTAAASRSVWPLSVASQEHSVAGVVIASAAAAVGPAVASVAAPLKPETVSEGHGGRGPTTMASQRNAGVYPFCREKTQTGVSRMRVRRWWDWWLVASDHPPDTIEKISKQSGQQWMIKSWSSRCAHFRWNSYTRTLSFSSGPSGPAEGSSSASNSQ